MYGLWVWGVFVERGAIILGGLIFWVVCKFVDFGLIGVGFDC